MEFAAACQTSPRTQPGKSPAVDEGHLASH
jgi:hypothetical protein